MQSRKNRKKKICIYIYTQACPIKTAENQRQKEDAERSQRKRHLTYRRTRIRITSDFVSETTKARLEWSEIFKLLKEKKTLTQNSLSSENYPSKVKEKQTFSDKCKCREFVDNRPDLQKVLIFQRRKFIQIRNSDLHKERKKE